jgi:hypothetical protein
MKITLLTPLYLSISWILTVSYQLFTDTAVKTLTIYIQTLSPNLAAWLNTRIETVVFIYAFTWIFLLSSVIPAVLLGGAKSVLIQYFVCLTIAFLALSVQNILQTYGGIEIQRLFSVAIFLNNPFLSVAYLAIPYIVMLGIDIHARRNRQKANVVSEEKLNKKENAPPAQNPRNPEENMVLSFQTTQTLSQLPSQQVLPLFDFQKR